jgi:bacteriocin biosynthesis cyclodehydratase domain-containing protein
MVSPYVRIIHCSDSEVLVKHGGRSRLSQIIEDEGRTRLLGKLLRNLRAPASLEELTARGALEPHEREDAAALLQYLLDEKVVVPEDAYLPHVYLDMQLGGRAARLEHKRVGLAGAGPLGTRIARDLGRLRAKGLSLLDDRRVSHFDPPFFDLAPRLVEPGATFAEAAQRGLEEDGVKDALIMDGGLGDEPSLRALFAGADFVIVALETFTPSILHAANAIALELRKPWMSVYADGSEAFVGPIYVPGETPCYNEREIQHEATIGLRDDYQLYKEHSTPAELAARHFIIPPYLGIMGGFTTTALLGFLLNEGSFAVAQCVRVDFERLSIDYENVLKLPRCPACRDPRPAYRNTYL